MFGYLIFLCSFACLLFVLCCSWLYFSSSYSLYVRLLSGSFLSSSCKIRIHLIVCISFSSCFDVCASLSRSFYLVCARFVQNSIFMSIPYFFFKLFFIFILCIFCSFVCFECSLSIKRASIRLWNVIYYFFKHKHLYVIVIRGCQLCHFEFVCFIFVELLYTD